MASELNGITKGQSDNPTRLPGIKFLFTDAYRLYASRFPVAFTISAIAAAVSSMFLVAGIWTGYWKDIAIKFRTGATESALPLFVMVVVAIIAVSVIQNICTIAIISALDPAKQRTVTESFRHALRRFWVYIFSSILMGFVVLGGFLLFIVPGVIFAIQLSLTNTVSVLENTGVRETLGKSRTLVRHRIGAVFLRLIIFAGIYAVSQSVVSWIFMPDTNLFMNLAGQFVNAVITPFFTTVSVVLYKHCRDTANNQVATEQRSSDI